MARIVCDENKCSGCLACVVACMDQHYEETQEEAVSLRLYEKKVFPSGLVRYATRSCLHCTAAACMEACPMQVFERTETGFVVAAIRVRCIKKKKCAAACPFDVPRFDAENKVVKCDGCAVRVACGLEPACVRVCNTGALKLVP